MNNLLYKVNAASRSLIFNTSLVLSAVVIAVSAPFLVVLFKKSAYQVLTTWCKLGVWLGVNICSLEYEVIGIENIPSANCIIMSKHQSTWDTLFTQNLFPEQTWVLKKQLLNIPFYGWALRFLNPIAIDRKSAFAVKAIINQGIDRLNNGLWVIIYPEGTRVAYGEAGYYSKSGAALSIASRKPILPIALNSGKFWGRKAFVKYPGKITVVIGKPIYPEGKTADEITAAVKDFIETTMQRL